MKTLQWLKNSKGEFEQVGTISEKVKWVYIEFLDVSGVWKTVTKKDYGTQEAFKIIVSAIEKKQTGKWSGYRLVPVEKEEQPKKATKSKSTALEEAVPVRKPTEKEGLTQSDLQLRPKAAPRILDEKKEEEEVEMAKTKKAKAAEPEKPKVLGYFRKDTAIGDLAEALLDEKPHKLSVLFDRIKKTYKVNPEFRLTIFKKEAKERGLCGILVDRSADTIQIKIGKGQPLPGKKSAVKAKATPLPPAAKKVAKSNGDATGDTNLSEVAKLVRKVLKSGDDWTKNKVVEKIHVGHGIEPKRIHAAIASEIKGGGVSDSGGLLSLSGN